MGGHMMTSDKDHLFTVIHKDKRTTKTQFLVHDVVLLNNSVQ